MYSRTAGRGGGISTAKGNTAAAWPEQKNMILREKDCPGGQSFLWVSCTSVTFWNKLLKNVVKRGKIQYDPKRQLKSGCRTIEE
jgi:hypothetical protein